MTVRAPSNCAALAAALLFAASCDTRTSSVAPAAPAPDEATRAQPVVYGGDDRMEWFHARDAAVRELASASTVALVRSPATVHGDGTVTFDAPTLGASRNLCPGERFAEQPRAGQCSGTLIDDDLVLTAGHCMEDAEDCELAQFVFNFQYESEGQLAEVVAARDVYGCSEVVALQKADGIDFAVVRLDRPVAAPHRPARVERSPVPVAFEEKVVILGFGAGIPLKIDEGGRVRNPRARTLDYFVASVDAFTGSSGSGVFDQSLRLRGVLARGAEDFERDGDCNRVRVQPEVMDEAAEGVIYAHHAIEALCALDPTALPCRGEPGDCMPCSAALPCAGDATCATTAGAATGVCVAACRSDADCRADHDCNTGTGRCVPSALTRCVGDALTTHDACGQVVSTTDCSRVGTCADGGCLRTGDGDGCGNAVALDAAATQIEGVWGGDLTDRARASCSSAGLERVYRLSLDVDANVVAALDVEGAGLHLRAACDDVAAEIACDAGIGRTPRIEAAVPPGEYFLFAEAPAFGPAAAPTDLPYELLLAVDEVCACSEGETRCVAGSRETCVGTSATCPRWTPVPCDEGETCIDGACAAAGPANDCGAARAIAGDSTAIAGEIEANHTDTMTASCGAPAAEQVYAFTLAEPSEIRAVLDVAGTLSIRERCDDDATEIACAPPDAVLSTILPDGAFTLVVDAPAGPYSVDWSVERACRDECPAVDTTVCVDARARRRCGNFDIDSCLEWRQIEPCEADERCEGDGACLAPSDTDAGIDSGGGAGSRRSGCAAAGFRSTRPPLTVAAWALVGGLYAWRRRGVAARGTPTRATAASVAAAVAAALLGGCVENASTPLDTFVVALESDPETFDPGLMSGSIEGQVAYSLFEGLLSPPPDDSPPVPGVAERWTTSDDGLEWTFHLRRDARWSNGDPVVAEDFRFAWLRLLRGDIAADYVSFVRYLENARAFELLYKSMKPYIALREVAGVLAAGVGVRAEGDHVLRVRLQNPTPFFGDVAMFYTLFPVHRGSIAQHGHDDAFRAEHMVTNGPFRIREGGYMRRNRIELEQNPYYWDRAALGVAYVTYPIIEDGAARVTAFLDGRVDWADDPPNNQLSILAANPGFKSGPQLGTYYFRLNVTHPTLSDVRVRRALSLALNREELCRCTLDDLYLVSTGFTPAMPGYAALDRVAYDPEQARRLLAEAGFPEGRGFPRIEILYNTSENHRVMAQFVQDQWRTELGIDVALLNQEWKVYLSTMEALQYQVARSGWIGDYVDPNTFLELWRTGDENNRTGWGDPRFDALVSASLRERDTGRRFALLREAEEILLDQVPTIPIYTYSQFHLVDPRVRGWEMNLRNTHLSRWVSKRQEASP